MLFTRIESCFASWCVVQIEARYIDPYADPIYEAQLAKDKAKKERDAEREALAAAKHKK